jgi:hypothetical protein
MATKEKFQELLEIEGKVSAYSFLYKGIDFWPFLRILIGYKEDLAAEKVNRDLVNKYFENSIRSEINSFFFNYKFSQKIKSTKSKKVIQNVSRKDVVFFSSTSIIEGNYDHFFNEWISPIKEIIKDDLTLEHIVIKGLGEQAEAVLVNGDLLIQDYGGFDRKAFKNRSLLSVKSAFGWKKQVKDIEGIKVLCDVLLDSSFGVTFSINELAQRFELMVLMIDFYAKWIKKYSPKVLVLYSFYSDFFLAIVYAARSIGIPVIDIQHGVIGSYHFAYTNWNAVRNDNFFIPNYCLTWNDFVAESINRTSGEVMRAFHVGDFSMFSKIAERDAHKIQCSNSQSVVREIPHVVISTGAKILPQELMQLINSDIKIFWHIKLHPRYSDETKFIFYKENIKKPNTMIHYNDGVVLGQLFEECDLHITEESAAVFEAERFGLKNIIVSEIGRDYFQQYIDSGDFIYCNFKELGLLKNILTDGSIYIKKSISTDDLLSSIKMRFKQFLRQEKLIS